MPVVSLTLAILRRAELGFLGVMVLTCRQTPLLCGQLFKAGDLLFFFLDILPDLINWEIVGIVYSFAFSPARASFSSLASDFLLSSAFSISISLCARNPVPAGIK